MPANEDILTKAEIIKLKDYKFSGLESLLMNSYQQAMSLLEEECECTWIPMPTASLPNRTVRQECQPCQRKAALLAKYNGGE